jgi:hypothetical protein
VSLLSEIYSWATNAGRREEPNGARKLSGFEAGDPVPPLTVNDLFGRITDWILGVGTGSLPTRLSCAGVGDWGRSDIPSDPGTYVAVGPVFSTLYVNDETSFTYHQSWGPMYIDGRMATMSLRVSAFTGAGTANVKVYAYNATDEAYFEYDGIDIGDSGTTIVLSEQDNPAFEGMVTFRIQVEILSPSLATSISIGWVEITWDAP